MARVKTKALIATAVAALLTLSIVATALAAEVEYGGPISGIKPGQDAPGVDLDASVKGGKVVAIESAVWAGLELKCGNTSQPLDANLAEPAKVTDERFLVNQEFNDATLHIRGRFSKGGAVANGTISAVYHGPSGNCVTGTHTWHAARG
jgi:hypothetical protein